MESMIARPTVVDRLHMTRQRLYNKAYWRLHPPKLGPSKAIGGWGGPHEAPVGDVGAYDSYGRPHISPGDRLPPAPVPFDPYPRKGKSFGIKGLRQAEPFPDIPRSSIPRRIALGLATRLARRLGGPLGLAADLVPLFYPGPRDDPPSGPIKPFFDPGPYGQPGSGPCVHNGLPNCGSQGFWVDPGAAVAATCLTGQATFTQNFVGSPSTRNNLHWFRTYEIVAPCLLARSQTLYKFIRLGGPNTTTPGPAPNQNTPSPLVPFADPPPLNPIDPDQWPPLKAPMWPTVPKVGLLTPRMAGLRPNVVAGYGGGGSPVSPGPRYPSPRARPNLSDPGSPHISRPPLPGEREKKGELKGSVKKVGRVVKAVANVTSETNDAVKAVYGSLPAGIRAGANCKTMQCMVDTLYKNAKSINVGKAVGNLIKNEVGDRVMGKIGQIGKKAVRSNPYWVSPVGLQAGGRYRPQPNLRGMK